MNELILKVQKWAEEKNLIEGSTSTAQFVKLIEEAGELAAGIAKKKPDKVEDSIGDVLVVLIILAKQEGFEIEDCLERAWDEIKDRKGRMVDGVFIKESDL